MELENSGVKGGGGEWKGGNKGGGGTGERQIMSVILTSFSTKVAVMVSTTLATGARAGA